MDLLSWDRYDPGRVATAGDRAVVVGGSVAGLCAAGVLADAFEEVVVLDRDPLPDGPLVRDGAPQTAHPHILLEAGRATLEDLFPGFSEALTGAGALVVDGATDMTFYDEGGVLAPGPERLPMYCGSRALFEAVLRRRVRAVEGVSLRGECRWTGYRSDGSAVTGVTYRDPDGDERQLAADLVVDAAGRTSPTPAWLADNGYESPPVDEVEVGVTYSTIRVERPPDDRRVLVVPPSSPRTRGGSAIPVEGDRWEVILQGVNGDDAPGDPAAFRSFAEGLPLEAFGRLVTDGEWVSDIERYPFPASLRRRYEDLDRFPDGLVVTGDAVASFNPVYGQGMSVAALDALALHHALATDGLTDLATRFFDRVGEVVGTVWLLAVVADFEFEGTKGPKPPGADLFNWYTSRLTRRAQEDGVLRDRFTRVFRLERSPWTLFRPGILWRAFRPRRG